MRPPFINSESESHLLSCEYGARSFSASYSLSYVQHVTAGIITTQAAPEGHSRSSHPSCYDEQISMEEALRIMDDEHQMQSHHQMRQLSSLQCLHPETREDLDPMQDVAAILARLGLEKHHRPIMEAQGKEEDAERRAMLKLQEWLGLAENLDELLLHQKAELAFLKKAGLGGGAVGAGGGGGSRGDTHRKRMPNKAKEKGEAQAEPRVKAKEKAKAVGSGRDRSGVWIERIRGELCCVRKPSEKKKK